MEKVSLQEVERRTEEYLKCTKSFEYYCANYVLLELPGGDKLFKLYKPQANLSKLILDEHFVLVLKSRQIGISTLIQALCSWLVTFHDNVVIGIISKDGAEATRFARHIIAIIEKLPKWMQSGFSKRTEQTFILNNGSKGFSAPVNPINPGKTLRGQSITFLVIDEAAFIKDIDEAWTSLVPALSTSQKQARTANIPYGTVVLSTPNKTVGTGEWFFKRYQNAVDGADIFKPFVIHWKDVQELAGDPEWYNTQCRLFNNDQTKIQQELELKFLPSGGSFFPEKIYQILQDNTKDDKVIKEKFTIFGGEVWKFEDPQKDKHYLVGVDTASEFGNDKSTITVWDYETLDQVWEYQTKCKIIDFIKVVKLAASLYPGTIVVERNSYGNQVMEELNSGEFSSSLYKEIKNSKVFPGLYTDNKTRPLMMDALYSYIVENPNCVKSKRLALELTSLVQKKTGKIEAEGMNDDLVLSTSFAFYVRKYDPPLFLNIKKHSAEANEISDILDLNRDGRKRVEDLNTKIGRDIKEALSKNALLRDGSYVDILHKYFDMNLIDTFNDPSKTLKKDIIY